ncbi:MAG: ATP phosphoribosyltransferase [Eubacterium sp.]|nr:ATP phosphoribosyltransferase [Eubacterium sp.]
MKKKTKTTGILDELRPSEILELKLRSLYKKSGYANFKMGKFEEYDLYSRSKDFIPSRSIITFSGAEGKLMALRPDITLSIVKNHGDDPDKTDKLYYSEKIYRCEADGDYREIMQIGLECLGYLGAENVCDVLGLAAQTMENVTRDYVLEISHLGILQAVTSGLDEKTAQEAVRLIGDKNRDGLRALAESGAIEPETLCGIEGVMNASGPARTVIASLRKILKDKASAEALDELEQVTGYLKSLGLRGRVILDFSIISNMKYYSGIIFKGYAAGIPKSILSGGRYDGLMEHLGKKGGAIGFALYLDRLEDGAAPGGNGAGEAEPKMLRVALPKGRLGKKVYEIFENAGYPCPEIKEDNRKLVFENREAGISFFWVKPSDVGIYVERGAADIGVAGKDILLEYQPDVYELMDLRVGKCRMAVAAAKGFTEDMSRTLRVATKFPGIARSYYEAESRDIDVIKLNGSIELAPVLGLSDVIVDIVETGKTLKENDLEVVAEVAPVSARLIANKAAYKFRQKAVAKLVADLERIIKE